MEDTRAVAHDERIRRVEVDPPIEQSGNVIQLGARRELWGWDGVSIGFDVIVPPNARVRTRSGSGRQLVDSVRGPVDASAGSGDIRIGRTTGTVRVSSGSGHIELEDSEGSVLARAGSGSITVMAVKGDVEARTGSGRVSATQTALGRTEVTSGSGSITVSGCARVAAVARCERSRRRGGCTGRLLECERRLGKRHDTRARQRRV